jgi:hypothetical protein
MLFTTAKSNARILLYNATTLVPTFQMNTNKSPFHQQEVAVQISSAN